MLLDEDRLREIIVEAVRTALEHQAPAPEYLTVSAAAAVASVTQRTVRNWISEGRLPFQRVGRMLRIKRADLERMISTPAEVPDPVEEGLRLVRGK